MDTNLEIINQSPLKKYVYGELYVFSIFDFMGKLFLAKMAENNNIEYPRDQDIEILDVNINDLYFEGMNNLNTRNWTIEGFDRQATFTIKYKRKELLVRQIIKIIGGTKINNIAKRIHFRSNKEVIEMEMRTRTNSPKEEYVGPFLDGKVWVNHLEAKGMPREKAQQSVEYIVQEYVKDLNNRA